MYGMPDDIMQISANIFAFLFADRFPIPANQAYQGVIRGENTGIANEVFAWSGHLRRQTFNKLASGHRNRNGAVAPRTFEGVCARPRKDSRSVEIRPRAK
jgi:hypothetical protein